jgi:hypothetical protein
MRQIRPLLALAVMITGCRSEPTSEADHDEHAEHVIPVHRPKDFPDGVRALRDLNNALQAVLKERGTPALRSSEVLSKADDIAGWLPEIAAESDMPEKTWNEVNTASLSLANGYTALRKGGQDASATLEASDKQIRTLEAIAAKASPHWFDKFVGASAPH